MKVTKELFRVLNGRLQDEEAKHRDNAYEVNVLSSIDKTVTALKELGALEEEVAGILLFKDRLADILVKKHEIKEEELKGDE